MADLLRRCPGSSSATVPEGLFVPDPSPLLEHQGWQHILNVDLRTSLRGVLQRTQCIIQFLDLFIHYMLDDLCLKHYITEQRYLDP